MKISLKRFKITIITLSVFVVIFAITTLGNYFIKSQQSSNDYERCKIECFKMQTYDCIDWCLFLNSSFFAPILAILIFKVLPAMPVVLFIVILLDVYSFNKKLKGKG